MGVMTQSVGGVFWTLAGIIILAHLRMVGENAGRLPESIPVHFDLLGIPDRYGGRKSVWILPLLALVIAGVCFASSHSAPSSSLETFIAMMNLEGQFVLLCASREMLLVGLGRKDRLGGYVLFLALLMIASPMLCHP